MKPVALFYATREGQTKRVAEHVAARLRGRGARVELAEVSSVRPDVAVGRFSAVVLAASVHLGKHEHEMIDFIKAHRAALEGVHTAFLSVSMSEASAELVAATPEQRSAGAAKVRAVLEAFEKETGFRPGVTKAVAGALRYSQYGFIVRLVMRSIARQTGTSTDTTHDVEYTDWDSLDAFADHLLDDLDAEADGRLGIGSALPSEA